MRGKLNPNCGVRLRECREAIGMTQKQLADAIHTTYQSISNIERGQRRLTVENARLSAHVLGVRMEYLLCEDDYKTEEIKEYCKPITAYKYHKSNSYHEIHNYFLDVEVQDGHFIIGMGTDLIQEFPVVTMSKLSMIECSKEEVAEFCKFMDYVKKAWFNEKLEKYNSPEKQIELTNLYKSYRHKKKRNKQKNNNFHLSTISVELEEAKEDNSIKE